MSVGGLYHYFANKRDLVLCGLRPDILAHRCDEFHSAKDNLMREDPAAYLEAFVRFSVEGIVFIRPSLYAAAELGSSTLWPSLETALAANTSEFQTALRAALTASELRVAGVARIGRTWRRVFFGLAMDREAPVSEIEEGLRALLRGYRVESPRLRLVEPSASANSAIG